MEGGEEEEEEEEIGEAAPYVSIHTLVHGALSDIGVSKDNCIENLNITNCNQNDFHAGWGCICTDQHALESVNNCVTSSCSSSDQTCMYMACLPLD